MYIYAHTATSAEEAIKIFHLRIFKRLYCQSRALLQCKRVENRKPWIRNRCHRLSSFYCLVLFCSLSSTVLEKLGLSSKFGNIQVANPARQPTNPGNCTLAQVPQTVKCVSLMEKKWLLIFLMILMIAASTFDRESIIRHNLSFPKQNYHLQKKITKHLMKELMNEYLTMELNSKDGMLACQK